MAKEVREGTGIAVGEMKASSMRTDEARPEAIEPEPLNVGDAVTVLDLDKDTGLIMVENRPFLLKDFSAQGEVVEARDHPPHVEDPGDDPNPSPHVRVRLNHREGWSADAWFNAARVKRS